MTVAFQASFQASLFDVGEHIHPGQLGATVERLPLSAGAWVDLRRHWINGSDALFERLSESVPWHAERRQMYDRVVDVPRLLSFFDEGQPLPDPVLVEAQAALDTHYRYELGDQFVT